MPILAFAKRREDLDPSLETMGHRMLIQVSDDAQRQIQEMLNANKRCCRAEQVEHLRRIQLTRSYDAEVGLLIEAIERDGEVYCRFL